MGLLGLNGAGKSTTMNMLTGFSTPSGGQVKIDGVCADDDPLFVKRSIGYMPELAPLYQDFTTREHLRFVCEARGITGKNIALEIERVCGLASITHIQRKLIRNLSKGYRQRVGLAAALVGNPKLLVLDEPSVGLDPEQLLEIRRLIRDLSKDRTILISSHILSEILSVCTRMIVLREGCMVADLTKNELMKHCADDGRIHVCVEAKHTQVQQLVCAIPHVTGCVSEPAAQPGYLDYTLTTAPDTDPHAEILAALVRQDIFPLAFYREQKPLEEVFLDLVYATKQREESK